MGLHLVASCSIAATSSGSSENLLTGAVTAMAVALPIEEVAERYGAYALEKGLQCSTHPWFCGFLL